MSGRAMVCIAFPFSQSRGDGRWRGFLLEKGGKELYSGGRGRGRGGFPYVRNLLDKSLIGKYKNEKTPTRNVASNVSLLARWFCLLILSCLEVNKIEHDIDSLQMSIKRAWAILHAIPVRILQYFRAGLDNETPCKTGLAV